MIALADIFSVSLDYLARPEQTERAAARPDDAALARELAELRRCVKRRDGYEYRSKTTLFGLPLVHIKISRYGNAVAKGIIAIGNISVGVLSLGGLALGLLSFGGVSLGLLFAFGGCALGGISFGGFSIGALAFGGFAVGIYAIGGSAFAHTLAVGATAMGNAGDWRKQARGEQVLMLERRDTGAGTPVSAPELSAPVEMACASGHEPCQTPETKHRPDATASGRCAFSGGVVLTLPVGGT